MENENVPSTKDILLKNGLIYKIVFYILIFTLSLVSLFAVFEETKDWLFSELQECLTWDSELFYTVGKAMANGLIPYQDMYENKPPMIFLLSEISYLLTGEFYMMNVLSFLSFLIALVIPPITVGIIVYKSKKNLLLSFAFAVLSIPFSMLLMDMAQKNSGMMEVEIYGAASGLLSFFFLALGLNKKKTLYSPTSIFAGIFFGIAVMLKEPFALTLAFGFLFFVKNKKDLLYRFVVPCVYGVITAFIILASSKCIVPYFTIYLNNMLFNHIEIYGSPFLRGLNIEKSFAALNDYSPAFEYFVCLIVGLDFVFNLFRRYSDSPLKNICLKLLNGLKVLAYLFIASFAIGLGGQYFGHHYVFALPFYFVIFFDLLNLIVSYLPKIVSLKAPEANKATKCSGIGSAIRLNPALSSLLCGVLLSGGLFFSSYKTMVNHEGEDYKADYSQLVAQCKSNASYLDSALDVLGQEKYLYIGFVDYYGVLSGYTSHLPYGPMFVQDSNNFKVADTFYTNSFINELEATNVIVFYEYKLGVIQEYTENYIASEFTEEEPSALKEANISEPYSFGATYTLYFRSSAFTF